MDEATIMMPAGVPEAMSWTMTNWESAKTVIVMSCAIQAGMPTLSATAPQTLMKKATPTAKGRTSLLPIRNSLRRDVQYLIK